MLRTLGAALGMVLGMLAGALWFVKRYDLKLPGRVTSTRRKRIEIVERLSVDGKRSVALIRRDGMEHLVMFGPEGQATIESGIVAPEPVAPERGRVPPRRRPISPRTSRRSAPLRQLVDPAQAGRAATVPSRRRATIAAAARNGHAPRAPASAPATQRNTTRWNRAAVRAALDA